MISFDPLVPLFPHFVPVCTTLYQFVPVCTTLYQFFLVAYRYVPLRPYFDPARSPIRLTDFGFGIGFPLAALSRRRQRVGIRIFGVIRSYSELFGANYFFF